MELKMASSLLLPCTVFSHFHKLLFVLMCISVLWCAVNMATLQRKGSTSKPLLESLGVSTSIQSADHGTPNTSNKVVTLSLKMRDGVTRQILKRHRRTSDHNSSVVMNATNHSLVTNSSGEAGANGTDFKSDKRVAWYDTAGWLPLKGLKPVNNINLTVLPMLAIIFFLFGICLKCYSWVRDQDRTKARGQLDFEDDEVNYSIITAGEQGYREVEFRSDTASMYDTVTSFRTLNSFPGNEHTVTSIKSLPNHPYEVHRQILLQQNVGVYDTVQSYKAFLEHAVQANGLEIEVEQVSDYQPRRRSKSYDFAPSAGQEDPPKNRKRRMRRHSGGRSVEGSVKTQTERERRRRHSEKSPGQQTNSEPFNPFAAKGVKGKTFHRRSSPAILEPLVSDSNLLPHELEEKDSPLPVLHLPIERQFSSSSCSSSDSRCRSDSRSRRGSFQKPRRERLRRNRSSQDRLSDRLVKGSSHSSGHCSDDSPQSSASEHGHSSNEIDSESDVTDSGLVAEGEKFAPHSCFRHPHPRDPDARVHAQHKVKRIQRFKVSFVDEASLSAASDGEMRTVSDNKK